MPDSSAYAWGTRTSSANHTDSRGAPGRPGMLWDGDSSPWPPADAGDPAYQPLVRLPAVRSTRPAKPTSSSPSRPAGARGGRRRLDTGPGFHQRPGSG